jgi:predicted acetyltransferase
MARANLRLERVSNARLESFVAMRDAFLAAGEDEWTGGAVIAHENPSAYIETLRGWREGINVPPNWGPAEAFFIMEGDVVVGQCDVRYPITPSLEQYGGHIGYHVLRSIVVTASRRSHFARRSRFSPPKARAKPCSPAVTPTTHQSG